MGYPHPYLDMGTVSGTGVPLSGTGVFQHLELKYSPGKNLGLVTGVPLGKGPGTSHRGTPRKDMGPREVLGDGDGYPSSVNRQMPVKTVPSRHTTYSGGNNMVSFLFQVIYCFIPKAGCSTWKRTIARSYTGKEEKISETKIHTVDFMSEHGMKRLYLYSDDEIQKRLKSYFKFLVVRHPIQRLVSAFRDKFGNKSQSKFRNYAREIRKQGKNSNLSLFNFIEYISSEHRNKINNYKKGTR